MQNLISPIGLLEGELGLLVLRLQESHKNQNKDEISAIKTELIHHFEQIGETPCAYTYSGGLTGYLDFINYFNLHANSEQLQIDDSSLTLLINSIFDGVNENLVEEGNYDFMHGAVGLGHFLLNMNKPDEVSDKLSVLVQGIEKISIEENERVKWYEYDKLYYDGKHLDSINFSLSHGITCIIVFLSKCYSHGIEKEKCRRMIEGAFRYIFDYKHKAGDSYSLFPASIEDGVPTRSRIGWCYGDLCIAIALIHASKALNSDIYWESAKEIFVHSSHRRTAESTGIRDITLCHGTAGLKLMYEIAYELFDMKKLLEASHFWKSETVKLYTKLQNENSDFFKDKTLLNGYPGVELAMSFQKNNEQNWIRFLLLDIL